VRLLADHATVVVSGTKIASEIGSSRSEVWRLVQQLRALGVEVEGHPATGYRLAKVADLLLAETLDPLLQGTMFRSHLHHFFKVGSTNVAAMEAAAAGAAEGSVFIAEEQTAGRGRGDHAWHSIRSDGIYLSVVLRPSLAPADVLVLSLIAGLVLRSALEQVLAAQLPNSNSTACTFDLRWPNDLLLNGRKVAGILTELTAEATRVRYAVLGMGINVNQHDFPSDLRAVATSLRKETGRNWSRVELTTALLKSLHREYRNLIAKGGDAKAEILKRFEENSTFARGLRVHVDEGDGIDGVTAGLDGRGFLQVKTAQGMRTVLSGGVRALE